MKCQFVRLDGSILQINVDFLVMPEVGDELRSMRIGTETVKCKYLGNCTFAEQEDFSKSRISTKDFFTIVSSLVILGFIVCGGVATVSANTGISPSQAVRSAASPLGADVTISNSEFSILSACDSRDTQLYRIRNAQGKEVAIVCGGSSIRLPWIPQKGFTLRYTN